MFLGAILWTYLLPGGLILPGNVYGLVREGQFFDLPDQVPAEPDAPAEVARVRPAR
jgi:hypothetical protein